MMDLKHRFGEENNISISCSITTTKNRHFSRLNSLGCFVLWIAHWKPKRKEAADLIVFPAECLGVGLVVAQLQFLPLLVEDVPVDDLLHPDDPVVQLPGVGRPVVVLVQAVHDLAHFLTVAELLRKNLQEEVK